MRPRRDARPNRGASAAAVTSRNRAAGVRGAFAFMQAQFAARDGEQRQGTSAGWVTISDRGEATSMSYAALVLSLTESDEEISLTLVPRNGSGLRGPREDEIDAAIADIRAAIATR
ncbi:hypothetical protein GCM10010458_21460 [Microbacterium luteolum]